MEILVLLLYNVNILYKLYFVHYYNVTILYRLSACLQAHSACFNFSMCIPIVPQFHDQHSIGDLYSRFKNKCFVTCLLDFHI